VAPTPPKPPRVVSYRAARIGGTVVSGFVFFMILWTAGAGMVFTLGNDPVVMTHARWLAAIVYGTLPLFAAHAAGVGFPDAFAQGRFSLPAGDLPPLAANVRATNPWVPASIAVGLVGLPVAVAAFWLTPALSPRELSAPAFVTRFAAVGALLGGLCVYVLTGDRFLREAAVPIERRRFGGSHEAYVWRRHVLPQALVNFWLHVWITFALIEGPLTSASSGMSRGALVSDAFGTGLVLALAVGGGTIPYVRFDRRWGVIAPLAAPAPGRLQRFAWVLGAALLAAALTLAVLSALGLEHVSVWPVTIARSLLCAAYAGLVAHRAATWALAAD
jgi:predicted outer membrane lipoprotein